MPQSTKSILPAGGLEDTAIREQSLAVKRNVTFERTGEEPLKSQMLRKRNVKLNEGQNVAFAPSTTFSNLKRNLSRKVSRIDRTKYVPFESNCLLPKSKLNESIKLPKKKLSVSQAWSKAEPGDADKEEVKQMVEGFQAQLKHIADSERYLLKPDTMYMQHWDHIMVVALLFTAIVTPYDVAFLEPGLNNMFVCNRAVDCVFLVDIFITFNLMYFGPGGMLIKNHRKIVTRYLKGWFTIDFITILPFDTVELVSSKADGVETLRFLRLFRLFKLLRIIGASRIYSRAETRLGISTSTVTTIKLVITLTLLNHWLGCAWAMVAFLQPSTAKTWFSNWLDNQHLTPDYCKTDADNELGWQPAANAAFRNQHGVHCWNHWDVYAACLHWSMMTVTSIG
jgi:hypothetical protein